MVANEATLFRVRRITHDVLFLRLRRYSPPPSADIEFPGFLERVLTLVAVNICRINSLFGYKMGYKIYWLLGTLLDIVGLGWKITLIKTVIYET